MFAVGCVLYSTTAVMLTPFISLYTESINDVNYYYPIFGILMIVCAFVSSVKHPYQYLAEGAGKFKETRNGAILEVIVNISVSAFCVIKFGLIGVLIGMLCASVIRTLEFAIFTFKNILNCSLLHLVKHFLTIILSFTVCFVLGRFVCLFEYTNYLNWAINAVFTAILSMILVLIISLLLYRNELSMLWYNLKVKFKK